MELHPSAGLNGEPLRDALEHLDHLPLPPEQRRWIATQVRAGARPATAPPLRRTPMAPERPRVAPREPSPGSRRAGAAAALRRLLLLAVVLGQTVAGACAMTAVLPYHGERPLELAILALSTVLFTWVSFGFWTAVAGFAVLVTRGDPRAIGRTLARAGELPREARTAVVMPICNEQVARVFAGLRATYTSLARTGALERFDFFVLSDTGDPDVRTAEAQAWLELCRDAGAFGRVFYRWRRHRIKRKSGNLADFCRRWGSRYRYMVVLDADSVMSGECLTSLVRLMEANPGTGIIQTAPRAARRVTPFGRMQQFAIRVYGPLFAAGLSYWQLGASYYWGHNAILRVEPFMRHCGLARLPGRGGLSGEILSHDFVEAALMRRAGWGVWIAYDLPGSYEEVPATLEEELTRDWRWCRGNLMNARFCLAEGMHPTHRGVFLAGVMSYLSAPLWLLSLALSTASVFGQALVGPRYFLHPRQLFPDWPQWHHGRAVALAAATAALLFVPKALGAVLVLARGSREFGGPGRLVASAVVETLASAVIAPVRMVFHALFVPTALAGVRPQWRSPSREDSPTTWGAAVRRYGIPTLLGIGWGAAVWMVAPEFLGWLLPVVGPLAGSIPVAVLWSHAAFGRRLRRWRVFVIPEETRPPLELRLMRRYLGRAGRGGTVADAVLDPAVNAAVRVAAVRRTGGAPVVAARRRLVAAALEGPAALGTRERLALLADPLALADVHAAVRGSAGARARWRAEQEGPDGAPPPGEGVAVASP
jgi:membrane glycosyltransferase